jgi:hypothetical protein
MALGSNAREIWRSCIACNLPLEIWTQLPEMVTIRLSHVEWTAPNRAPSSELFLNNANFILSDYSRHVTEVRMQVILDVPCRWLHWIHVWLIWHIKPILSHHILHKPSFLGITRWKILALEGPIEISALEFIPRFTLTTQMGLALALAARCLSCYWFFASSPMINSDS